MKIDVYRKPYEKWFGNRMLPKDAYKVDGVYDFKIRKIFTTCCEVIDDSTDITAYLRGTANLKLFKGQVVKRLPGDLADMGTISNWVAPKKAPLPKAFTNIHVSSACQMKCKQCARVCPMQLTPYDSRGEVIGYLHPDCLKCGKCTLFF